MIGDILQPTHLLFILVVALLVLGPKRLPEAGRALGTVLRDFRMAISGEDQNNGAMPAATMSPPAPMAAAPVSPTFEPAEASPPPPPAWGPLPQATESTVPPQASEAVGPADPADDAETAEPAHPFV